MGPFIGFLGLVAMLIGAVSVVVPLTRFRITSRKMGAAVSLAGLIVMVVGVSVGNGGSSGAVAPAPTSTTAAPQPVVATSTLEQPPTPDLIQYRIVGEEDVSFLTTQRIALRVTVEEGATADQVLAVAEEITDTYRRERHHHALSILFYHYEELSSGLFTVGRYEDVPYGDWGRADEAKSDYSNFEPVVEIRNVDWSGLPTPDQVAIQVAFDQVAAELRDTQSEYASDEDIFPIVAEQLGIDTDSVRDATQAVLTWTLSGSLGG